MSRSPIQQASRELPGPQPDSVLPFDYFVARSRFCIAAEQCSKMMSTSVKSCPIEARGPEGQPLTIETVLVGQLPSRNLVIVSSGLHGVEGFLGSQVQTAMLQDLHKDPPPPDTAILFIHAINPYGFSHLRRVNEQNIDLNRNFLLGDELTGTVKSPRYAALDPYLNPRTPPSKHDRIRFAGNALRLIAKNKGIKPLSQTIAEGQYEYAKGLFYGGKNVAQSTVIVQDILTRHATRAKHVCHIDLHTGLGPHGLITLLGSQNIARRVQDRIRHAMTSRLVLENTDAAAYQARGTLGRWCDSALGHPSYTYLCAEAGTYGPVRMLLALREENQAAHWAPADSTTTKWAKKKLLNASCPDSDRWRRRALDNALTVVKAAVLLLADTAQF